MDVFENTDPTIIEPRSRYHRIARKLNPKSYGWCHSGSDNWILSIAWVLSGLLAVLIPLIHRTIHKNKYREMYMTYYWEHEYQQYAEQRKQNYEQYGNNYNYYGVYAYDGSAEREWVDVNNCKWWKFNCFSFYANREGEAMPDQEWYPNWYSGFSTTEEERQEMEENLEQPGSLKFVYVWQLFMFLVILFYGSRVFSQNQNPTGLIVALLVWANFCFLSMWLMADNSIMTEGQQVFRSGFYGQISVLVFMTNFWYFIHGLFFVIVFLVRASCLAEQRQREIEEKEMLEERRRVLVAQEQNEAIADKGYNAPSTR